MLILTVEVVMDNKADGHSRKLVERTGNNNYFIGLDIGTNSVGWALTDDNYNLQKVNGKSTWGVRLFDEAVTAKDRRTKRSLRRRLHRRRVRLNYLRELFRPAIEQIDSEFFKRLENSYLYINDDKQTGTRVDFAAKNNAKLYGESKRFHLFEGQGITDREYYSDFPTIYHLRKALIDEKITKCITTSDGELKNIEYTPHYNLYDPRLVYLALSGHLKNRGHFLYDIPNVKQYLLGGDNLKTNINNIANALYLSISGDPDYSDVTKLFKNELEETVTGSERAYKIQSKKDKLRKIKEIIKVEDDEDWPEYDFKEKSDLFYKIISLAFGSTVTFKKPKESDSSFLDKIEEDVKIDFNSENIESEMQNIISVSEELGKAVKNAYEIYVWATLHESLQGEMFVCMGKVKVYNTHKEDLLWLKSTVRDILKDDADKDEKYGKIFGSVDNGFTYEAYVHHGIKLTKDTRLASFIDHIEKVIGNGNVNGESHNVFKMRCDLEENKDINSRIKDGTFLPVERSSKNSTIPNVIIKAEYDAILDKAAKNGLTFLTEQDKSKFKNDGSDKTPKDKIASLVCFRIPYYVGPLAYAGSIDEYSVNKWLVRNIGYENREIMPWIFDAAINKGETRKKFIERMVSDCTYLKGCKALPKSSLTYQKMTVLEELNNLRYVIKGENLPYEGQIAIQIKQHLYHEIFEKNISASKRNIIKAICDFYRNVCNEDLSASDVDFKIGGEDGTKLKSSLSSYLALKDIPLTDKQKEELIKLYTVFGQEKDIAREEAERYDYYKSLNDEQKNYIHNKLSVSGWGRYSKEFLTTLTVKEPTTNVYWNILSYLWETNYNIQALLYGKNGSESMFRDRVNEYNHSSKEKPDIYNVKYSDLDDLFVPINVKRAIWQSVKIVRELIKVSGCKPKKIFIETTRQDGEREKVVQSRYKQLFDKYNAIKKQTDDINDDIQKLNEELEQYKSRINAENLYLYFMQCGKDMYSGKNIPIKDLLNGVNYDVDHIYPRSLTSDDSIISNKVLVYKDLNHDKGNRTLKASGVIKDKSKVLSIWSNLAEQDFIDKEKLRRLKYSLFHDELEDSEIEDFVKRQLVEASQSSKAVKDILNILLNLSEKDDEKTEIVFSKAKHVSDFRNIYRIYKSRDINDMHHAKDAYLNIVVGNVFNAVFTHSYWKQIKTSLDDESKKTKNVSDGIFAWKCIKDGDKVVWQGEESRRFVEKTMRREDVLLTRMQTTGKGALFDETVYSAKGERDKDGVIPVKNNDIHYGYYNKMSSSFFVLIEYQAKKSKKEMSIESIPLWFYKKNAQLSKKYIVKKFAELPKNKGGLGLKAVKVLSPFLRVKTLLTATKNDGFIKGYISAKHSESTLLLKSADMLKFGEFEPYAIQVCKYIERKKEKKELTVEEFNYRKELTSDKQIWERDVKRPIITKECNIRLYEYLIDVHKKACFINRPASKLGLIEQGRDKFVIMSLELQIEVLYNIIKYLNGDTGDFVHIDGKKGAGRFVLNKNINNETFITNQSVTGLFNNSFTITTEE